MSTTPPKSNCKTNKIMILKILEVADVLLQITMQYI